MKTIFLVIGFFLFAAAIPQTAVASYISMETKITSATDGINTKILVTVTNKGDEPAHDVKISAAVASKQYEGRIKNTLRVKEQYTEEFLLSSGLERPGRYSFPVMVEYSDANRYPFSAISIGYCDYKGHAESSITGSIPEIILFGTSRGGVIVRNPDSAERKLAFELVSSKEFGIEPAKGKITVGPGMSKTIPFTLRNLSARQGSTYPIFALVGYDSDGFHYAKAISGIISIKRGGFLREYREYLVALLVMLVLIIIFSNIKGLRENAAKG